MCTNFGPIVFRSLACENSHDDLQLPKEIEKVRDFLLALLLFLLAILNQVASNGCPVKISVGSLSFSAKLIAQFHQSPEVVYPRRTPEAAIPPPVVLLPLRSNPFEQFLNRGKLAIHVAKQ